MLTNYLTDPKRRVDSERDLSPGRLEDLLERVQGSISYDQVYRWDANLNGVVVRYIGNSFHQYDFWVENWWPAPNDDSVLPRAFIYSAQGVEGEEPYAYYCPERHTAVFVNTEYYGQCKSWALGMAAAILEEGFNTHSIHGACAEVGGKGVVLIAPTGTGKTTLVNKLFQQPGGKIVGDDWVYIRHPEKVDEETVFTVRQPERTLYVRTENVEKEPWLEPLFDRCKCENVVTRKEECTHPACRKRMCDLDRGKKRCYGAFANARAMLPREWMRGPEKVLNEARLHLIVLLRRDDHSPSEVWLDPDEAIEILREGEYRINPGAGPKEKWGTMGKEPWYNPYLLQRNDQRQEEFFRREFEVTKCLVLNTGPKSETAERTLGRILRGLERC
jgi:hypothetical protein